MTRFWMGWVPRIGGPAVKVMVNDWDDPRWHPNEDYGAFRFNSETAAIGYGDHRGTQTVVPRSLTWLQGQWYDNWLGQILARTQGTPASPNPTAGWITVYANPPAIWPNLNSFYYFATEDAAWKQVWSSFNGKYSGSQDMYHVTRRGMARRQQEMIVPTKTNGAWGAAGYGYLDPASTLTDVRSPPVLYEYPTGVSALSIDSMPVNTYSFYSLDLPVDEMPYPTASPPHPSTPANNRLMFYMSGHGAQMAKPGYDLNYITNQDQLIFNSDKLPMKVVRTGVVDIAQDGVVGVPLGANYSQSILVDYQVQRQGSSELWLPAWPADVHQTINVRHRVNGSTLELSNISTMPVTVRYVVMAADDIGVSSGTAKVFENGPWGTVVRRPGSAGTSLKDTIIDSRLAYLPIVSQGWVPFDSFNNAGGTDTQQGTRSHTVWWNNPGNFKPYVIAKCARQHKTNGQIVYQDFFGKYVQIYSYFSDSTFMCQLHDNAAVFFASDGNRIEDAARLDGGRYSTRTSSYRTIGIRYYVFAIPVSL